MKVINEDESKIIVPPIKCQGIKTKLVPFIKENVKFDNAGTWIEPFVGTGVVVFNLQPQNALLSDKNQNIISFYKGIQDKLITPSIVREFLEYHGQNLSKYGEEYYKKMRDEFNRKGNFNVPFCQKPNRFSKAYITKICNQIEHVSRVMEGKNWKFLCCPWQETMSKAKENDYIYLDPPYIGRDTSYVGEWPESEAIQLSVFSHKSKANVCLSMWKENQFRRNEHLYKYWGDFAWFEQEHFYHIGAKESNRHPITEILAIKNK